MKYVSRPIIIEAELYKPGLEDGIYCPIKRTECDLCINNCKTKVPYVREKDGRITLVNESHYILSSDNGKTVMPMHKFTALYKPAEFIDVSN
ncbi:MAG TPA: hypothetical protein PK390_04580 [Fervidobacterium nodosum]|nr:hypothetical protein [Fervidobacterium nodosum]